MKKQFLSLIVLLSVSLSHASSPKVTKYLPQHFSHQGDVARPSYDCTFSAAINLSIMGQSASISCSSTKPACDQAVNEVAQCVKFAKKKLTLVLGL